MAYKWMGVICIILSCGYFGLSLTLAHKREEGILRQLLAALDFMECELQYRLTPLPELCRQAGLQASGQIKATFLKLAEELEIQLSPDVSSCMHTVMDGQGDIPPKSRNLLLQLGNSLGRFDLDGQIKGLDSVRADCRRILKELTNNREMRLRSYQTLSICAGAALAILFI